MDDYRRYRKYKLKYAALKLMLGGYVKIKTPEGRVFDRLRPYQEDAVRDYLLHRRRGWVKYRLGTMDDPIDFSMKLVDKNGTPTLIMKRDDGSENEITEFAGLTTITPSTSESRRDMVNQVIIQLEPSSLNYVNVERAVQNFVADGRAELGSYRLMDLGDNRSLLTKELIVVGDDIRREVKALSIVHAE